MRHSLAGMDHYNSHDWEFRDGYYEKCVACGLIVLSSRAAVTYRVIVLPPCPCQEDQPQSADEGSNG